MKRSTRLALLSSLILVLLTCQLVASSSAQRTDSSSQARVVTVVVQATPANLTAITNVGMQQQQDLLVALYERVNPGVVAIQTVGREGGGLGAGFVYDKEGHIVTNYHVIEGATDLEVDFPSGLKTRAKLIATDMDSDLAVVKVDVPSEELYPLTLGDSDLVKVGQTVIAIGSPFGLSGTMTVGIVSARGRTLDSVRQSPTGGYYAAGDIIQTDAAINPGNSGGPLLNLSGEVIGINRAIRTAGSTPQGDPVNSGIGFSIAINIIKRVVPVLIETGRYDYPYLGISFHPELTLLDQEALGLPNISGVYVAEITPGSPAEEAGLTAGSRPSSLAGLLAGGAVVLAIDERPVRELGDLMGYLMSNKNPGDQIVLSIIRDNNRKEVTVTLGKRP